MRKLALTIIAPLLFLACGKDTAAPPAAPEPGFDLVNQQQAGLIPNHYIVVFTDAVADPPGVAREMALAHGLGLRHTYARALKGFAAVVPPGRVAALRADPRVRYVTPDRVDRVHQQGGLPTGIDRIEADLNTAGSASDPVDVDIAFLDTGIDIDHPDLNVYRVVSFAGGNGEDGNGHGTHVAGTAAALDDGAGVVGVAPGARIWAVKVCNNGGSCSRSDVIAGIDYVVTHADEIDVVNMSLGGRGSDDGDCGRTDGDAEHEAICRADNVGVVFVVSAGNGGPAANLVPAAFDEVITVSALADFDGKPGGAGASTCRNDEDDSFADFSSYGPDVDLMAPGVCIESTWKQGGYNIISGTSMAAPHVTGTVALYLASHDRDANGDGLVNAADVDFIRSVLVGSGIQQSDACGLTTFDDPDGIPEPIVFANASILGGDGACGGAPPVAAVDLAVSRVAAPAVADPGQLIEVRVTVRNISASDVTQAIPVTLVSDNATAETGDDLAIGTETLPGLAAGMSTDLVFSWNTADANPGDHTITASHGFTDDNATNDSATAVVTLATTMHVGDLERASTRDGGGTWTAWVRITVHDPDHAALSGDTVVGTWGQGATEQASCVTDPNGMCEVSYPLIPNRQGNVLFTVNGLKIDGYAYDGAANHDPDENSDGTAIRVFYTNSDDYKK